jgi:hypothetical protein
MHDRFTIKTAAALAAYAPAQMPDLRQAFLFCCGRSSAMLGSEELIDCANQGATPATLCVPLA